MADSAATTDVSVAVICSSSTGHVHALAACDHLAQRTIDVARSLVRGRAAA